MLTVIVRAILIFVVLLIVIRMMGKRQIGEMEPFELAITLVIAELACIPMADKSIPLTYGIVSILTMYVVHQVIILISKRNLKFQDVVSGSPIVILDKNGVRLDALKSMNMQMGDLLQAMRAAGYFSIDQIAYAMFETNGQLSVIPNPKVDTDAIVLPVPIIIDGQWSQKDLDFYHINKAKLESELTVRGFNAEKLLVAILDETGKFLVHPENQKYFVLNLDKDVIYYA